MYIPSKDPSIIKLENAIYKCKNFDVKTETTLKKIVRIIESDPTTKNGTKYIYTINHKPYVLAVMWNDFSPYCIKPFNKKIQPKPSFAFSKSAYTENIPVKYLTEDMNYYKLQPFVIPNGMFFILIDELHKFILDNKENIDDENYMTKKLKIKYGFPLTHNTSVHFTFMLIPIDCIIRPSFISRDAEKNINSLNFQHKVAFDNLRDNIITSKWDPNPHNHLSPPPLLAKTLALFDDLEKTDISTVYPFTGCGYTYNYMNMTDNEDPPDIYGFTEFITFARDNDTKVYVITNCNFNDYKGLSKYLSQLTEDPIQHLIPITTDYSSYNYDKKYLKYKLKYLIDKRVNF